MQISRAVLSALISMPRLGLTLGLCALVLGCPYGDVWYRLAGRVSDPNGRPIQGALVWVAADDTTAVDASRRTATDSSGYFLYDEGTAPVEFRAVIHVDRQGFQPLHVAMPNSSVVRLRCIELVLEPLGAAAPSRIIRADSTSDPRRPCSRL